MSDDSGWRPVTAASDPWRPWPQVLMFENGGFLEHEDSSLMLLEST